ncbi:hypothetical protein BS78_05G019600 [Paspalum vaginatum]|nr:hypothetical protein BS78_05G019600 [Paspalum vaginatum]
MAETALLLVVKRIGIALAGDTLKIAKDLLAKRSEMVAALPSDMKLIKNELELIHAFIKGIDRKGVKNEIIEAYTAQVRTLAYEMEDVVDQFIYVVGEHNPKGIFGYFKKIGKKPCSLFSLDEIATDVKRINKELKDLSERMDRWTKPMDDGAEIPAAGYEIEQVYPPGPVHDYLIKDEELVGTDENKKTLIDLLCSEDQPLRIIALWGMGGVGKSTIVNSVYRTEAFRFDCCVWISVSESYKLEDIWKTMLKKLVGKDESELNPEAIDSAELRVELIKFLDKKRYLIILDDVWTSDALFRSREVLVDNGLGSRVIITTRMDEVASIADDGYKIKIEPLHHNDAWLLFCRKAFPRIENHICPPDLHKCCIDILEKINGLPLALVAIGSLLSLRPRTEREWRNFYNQLTSELHRNENLNHVVKVLNLSYKHLPGYLKNCFLYAAIFPEDFLLYRKRMIKLWIAEGFVEQIGTCSLEDIAEGYLVGLVRRSMFEVVELNRSGRIRSFRMHDLVRELAIFQSRKERFSTVCYGRSGLTVGVDARRLSVILCSNGIPSHIDLSRLRTFMAFGDNMGSSLWHPVISKSKFLSVLDLSGLPINVVPDSIGDLFNLKLLCLDDTSVRELPKSIKKLRDLQTLSLKHSRLANFPEGVSKLVKLRHINASHSQSVDIRLCNNWEGVEPFKGIWYLTELQSLSSINSSELFVAKLGHLTQLRYLSICDVRSGHCAKLCNSLSQMHELSKLFIQACSEDEVLQLDSLSFPNPLQKVYLGGCLSEKTLESPFFLKHGHALLHIGLKSSQLSKNQLSQLSELAKLTVLDLDGAYTEEDLHFHTGWFRNLKIMVLIDLTRVNQICIDKGALVSLEHFCISNPEELREIPVGINFLTSLKEAHFLYMHPDLPSNALKEKLDHIPDVYVVKKAGIQSAIDLDTHCK